MLRGVLAAPNPSPVRVWLCALVDVDVCVRVSIMWNWLVPDPDSRTPYLAVGGLPRSSPSSKRVFWGPAGSVSGERCMDALDPFDPHLTPT